MTTAAALAAGLTLTAAALAPVPAAAHGAPAAPGADDLTWAVRPSGPTGPSGRDYFVYTASPGQTIKDKVSISNLSGRTLTFRVYATDAFNTADGAFTLLTADRAPTGIGTWLKFGGGFHSVKAGKTVQVPFTLTVPHDATPGDHGGGIIASITQQQTTARGQRVNVDRRVAARVYLRAQGPVTPSLQISELRTGYSAPVLGGGRMKVTYTVRNTGNIRVTALARIGVQGPFGVPLGGRASRRIPELLPGNSYTFTEQVGGIAPAGRLTASVRLSLTDPQNGTPLAARPVARRSSLWNVPWLPISVVLVIAAALVVRRRRPGAAR
ncbi:protein of unknown function [Thermomonospora echinospora]|uniref:DUF916 domain-containing protein n=1 Tax=Thermomonospora echinospora TaxID=1992 RepID=A0A1H6CT75_9ACTN|nr:DUF916 domain-containing protein [Thermomonospora echinospora]SEG76200.1 protein of unknown function [Thermomonospora echinospora]